MGLDIKDLLPSDDEGRLRIIQEQVPGNQISLAHIIGGPQPIIYQKLGLNPDIDYDGAAIGILTVVPYESSVIAADIATKAADIYLGFVDRFSGTLIITGERDYRVSYTQSLQYFSTLQSLGIPSRLIVFDNDGHWPSSLKSMPLY